MCWVYSKQKITVVVAQGPWPRTNPHCSSHSRSTEEVKSHYVNTQGPVFGLALLSSVYAAKNFRVVSHVPKCSRKQPAKVISQRVMGKHICPFYRMLLGETACKLTLPRSCFHGRVDVLAVDDLFSLMV